MATREVADALGRLREAERCVTDQRAVAVAKRSELDAALARYRQCEFEASRARQDYDLALQRQSVLQAQYDRIDRVLASGSQQTRISGSLRDVKKERDRLRGVLTAASV